MTDVKSEPRIYAFPRNGAAPEVYSGMLLRDYFAGQALMAMGPEAVEVLTVGVGDPAKVDLIYKTAARMAYRFADAMLEARK